MVSNGIVTDWHPDIPLEYRNQIVTGDARQLAEAIPDESIDLVVTDPPYGIEYKSNREAWKNGKRKRRANFGADIVDTSWLRDVYRIQKNNTCLYLFTRWDVLHIWKLATEQAGFSVAQHLIWDKSHWGMGDLRYYGTQTESILFCVKGSPQLNWPQRKGNLFKTTSKAYYPEGSFNHATQKPENLLGSFVNDASLLGQVVLDPFVGSGTTAAISKKLGRNYIAFEIDPTTADLARERVRNTQPPLLVPQAEQSRLDL